MTLDAHVLFRALDSLTGKSYVTFRALALGPPGSHEGREAREGEEGHRYHLMVKLSQSNHRNTGGLDVIRKEARPLYRTSSGFRLCWELEKPKGPKFSSALGLREGHWGGQFLMSEPSRGPRGAGG